MTKVFLGVGHGGRDPGAVGNGLHEADLNLQIALACKNELERHGVIVGMSRTKDENDAIDEEIRECNAFDPAVAVDIHNNAGGGDGAEVYHHHIKGGTSEKLAANILNAIVEYTGQNSRGLKTKLNAAGNDYYGFIRSVKAPSVIVECAFIDNKKDIAIIDTAAEQNKMGVAIARGILLTLGVAYKEQSATPATPALDNTPDAYAADAVKWAIEEGILKGDANGNYNLHGTITRQDVIVFLYRVFKV